MKRRSWWRYAPGLVWLCHFKFGLVWKQLMMVACSSGGGSLYPYNRVSLLLLVIHVYLLLFLWMGFYRYDLDQRWSWTWQSWRWSWSWTFMMIRLIVSYITWQHWHSFMIWFSGFPPTFFALLFTVNMIFDWDIFVRRWQRAITNVMTTLWGT